MYINKIRRNTLPINQLAKFTTLSASTAMEGKIMSVPSDRGKPRSCFFARLNGKESCVNKFVRSKLANIIYCAVWGKHQLCAVFSCFLHEK